MQKDAGSLEEPGKPKADSCIVVILSGSFTFAFIHPKAPNSILVSLIFPYKSISVKPAHS